MRDDDNDVGLDRDLRRRAVEIALLLPRCSDEAERVLAYVLEARTFLEAGLPARKSASAPDLRLVAAQGG
jgi:hypothetical protein